MLLLYKNITPNYSKTHYYFKDFAKFLDFLQPNKVTEVEDKRYSLFNGFIRIAIDNVITDLNYNEITYIIDTHNNICYHVSNIQLHTTFVIYNVEQDLWGSYIYKAKLDNINVLRCNRKISDNGVYDEIKDTKEYNIETIGDELTYDTLSMVLIIKAHGVRVTGDIDDYLVIGAPLRTIDKRFYIPLSAITNWAYILCYTDTVNMIKKKDETGTGENFYKFDIVKAYLLPSDMITYGEAGGTVLGFTLGYNNSEVSETGAFRPLKPSINTSKTISIDIDANKNYIVGTQNNGIQLTRKIKSISYNYTIAIEQSELKIFVNYGNIQKDITYAFELLTSVSKTQDTSLSNIANSFRIALGVLSTGLGVYTGHPIAFTKGLQNITTGTINLKETNNQQPISSITGTGNAYTTYFKYIDGQRISKDDMRFNSPYYINISTSLQDEYKHARKLGVNFNEYINLLEDIFTFELLGSGEDTDDTYLLCNTDISNVPTNAIDVIENKLKEGIYLQYLN